MSSITISRIAVAAIAVLGAYASPAQGQFYGNGCNTCTPVQPVVQSCYQTVPVTEYQPVRQTVKRPVYRTEYVEQPVTVYRPVTETRTSQVPTVRYQSVTSYRTVHRNMGRWVTQYRPNPRMAPCQYDNRPGVIGWVNRTTYQMRNAFKPQYTPIRQYQPRMVACTVPQTRQVAVRGTRSVSYNVTRMVPTQTVQRRPVQRLSYVEQEVTVMRPRTTYRTVPIGTSVAYAPYSGGGSAVAYAPYSGSSSIAYAPYSTGSSVAYDSFGSGTIRNAEVIDDRAIDGGTTRSADLVPEPDERFRSADREIPRAASTQEVLGKERYSRPTRSAKSDTRTSVPGSRFDRDRESRVETPATRSGFSNRATTQPKAPSSGGASRYEPQTRPRIDATQKSGTGTEMFKNDTMFDDFNDPSARVIPSSSKYMRTSTSKRKYNGWQASRVLPVAKVTKATATRVSMAKR